MFSLNYRQSRNTNKFWIQNQHFYIPQYFHRSMKRLNMGTFSERGTLLGLLLDALRLIMARSVRTKQTWYRTMGTFTLSSFLLRSSQIFTLRVKTSPNEKKILPLLTLNVKVFYIKGNFYIKGCNKGYYIHQKISTYMYVKNYWITLCVHHPSLKLHKHFINSRMLPSITVRSCILVHNFYQVLVHRNFTMLCLPYWILPGAP